MQIAVIEFARHVAGLEGANSTEFDPQTEFPVIDIMADQKDLTTKGGNMRLGACVRLVTATSIHAYGKGISELHRHRYEFNNDFRDKLEEEGLRIAANPERDLVEIVEISSTRGSLRSSSTGVSVEAKCAPTLCELHRGIAQIQALVANVSHAGARSNAVLSQAGSTH